MAIMAEAWAMEDRIQAAVAWLITGDVAEAAKLAGIPTRTIYDWMSKSWWDDVLSEAKNIKQKELDAVWTGIIHKATSQIKDRIENGDPYVKRNGELGRVPIKAKDLATIMATATDKRSLIRGQVTSRTEKITIDQRLEKITNKLDEQAKVIESA